MIILERNMRNNTNNNSYAQLVLRTLSLLPHVTGVAWAVS